MRRWLKHWRDRLASQRAGTVQVQSIFGPMTAFAGDFATRQIEQFGAHTRNEVALLRSFVKAGDLMFLLDDNAELIVARSNRTKFEPLKTYVVADSATWAQPAISGNRVFIKDVLSLALWTVN